MLENIRDYIKRDSEYYATRFVEKIIQAVDGLVMFPKIGRHVPESEEGNIRELLFHNYRIMYRAETERILILRYSSWIPRFNRKENKAVGYCLKSDHP